MKNIYVTKPYLPPIEEYEMYLRQIWDNSILTNQGGLHIEFEKELKNSLGFNEVSLTVNGHLALDIALKALDLKGEVITTPFTFASTTHAISMNGLTPVFCDIKSTDYTIDESKIEALITDKTCAIMPVHVYGYPCNVDKIQEIAEKHNLKVIYDAAHAFGVKVNGQPISDFGDISMFSFHATKLFHSIEGGVLTYSNPQLKRRIDLLKNFGISNAETVELIGINAKMNEFQAAMGLCNLKHFNEIVAERKTIIKQYTERLKNISGIKIVEVPDNVEYNYAYFPIYIDAQIFGKNRDEVAKALEAENIFARKYFHPLVTQFDCYKEEYKNCHLPVAEDAARSIMTLPLYVGLALEDVDRICNIILKCR